MTEPSAPRKRPEFSQDPTNLSEFWQDLPMFIFGVPLFVGMLTVYLAERQRRRTWAYYIIAPLLATGLFVAGTLILLIEGAICAIVIIPMFAMLGAIGGLFMGYVCRVTNWPRPPLQCAAALPLILAMLGAGNTCAGRIGSRRTRFHDKRSTIMS